MKIYPFIKRIMDFFLSFIGLVVLGPVFMMLAVLIKFDSKGPVFFKQMRVGKDRMYFYILKFRTMRTDAPKDMPTHLLQNPDVYITRVGRFLRKSSLDELPQIINILKGEMSIVGPRPALWNQYDLLEERERYEANTIRPGLTGWAQINGRDELPIQIKAELDGEYVMRMGFVFDMRCIFKTILSVLKTDGIVEGAAKETTFSGDNR